MKIFEVNQLLEEARQRTGLSNFGNDHFMEGLEVLVRGINNSTEIADNRYELLGEHFLMRPLMNLLYRAKDLAEHAEILEQKLLSPVVVSTSPRSGSSYLQRLLGSTDGLQGPLTWQVEMSARIPGLPDGGIEQRKAKTLELIEWRVSHIADFQAVHPMAVEIPEEEVMLTEPCFRSINLDMLFDLPEYREWINQVDMTPAYDFLREQLQYVQWQFFADNPKPYAMKAIAHLGNEDQLLRIFPDGPIIMISHRDPVKMVASTLTHMDQIHQHFYDGHSLKPGWGEKMLEWLLRRVNGHMAWRDRNPDFEVLDLNFVDICRDSIATAEKIYDFAGMELTEEGKRRIRQWDEDHPRDKHGRIQYSLEKYGLTEERVREAYAPYIERFADYME